MKNKTLKLRGHFGWKNLKLWKKLGIGFGTLTAVTMLMGYMGWSNLALVNHKVAIGDNTNQFIQLVNTARFAEKQFILHGEKKHADQMIAQKKHIDALAETLIAQLDKETDKQLVEEMRGDANAYFNSAKQYIGWSHKIADLTKSSGPVSQSAHVVQDLAKEISNDQKAGLATVMTAQAKAAQIQLDHMKWNVAMKAFLSNQDKNAKLNVQTDGHKCAFGKWLDSSDLEKQSRVCGDEFHQTILGMKQKHLELHRSAIQAAEARSGKTDTSLQVYQQTTAPLISSFLGKFAAVDATLKAKAAERLEKSYDAEQISRLVLEARRSEKDYFARGKDKYIKKVDKHTKHIVTLAKNLQSRFRAQENKEKAQKIIDAVAIYKRAFDHTVLYKNKEAACEKEMEAAATKLTQRAYRLGESNKAEIVAAVANASFTIIMLAIVGAIVGVMLSLIIVRSIVGPLRKSVQFAEQIADGDLTQQMDLDQEDEIGVLVKALNGMVVSLREAMKSVAANAKALTGSSSELLATATDLTSGTKEASVMSSTAASAAEEMSTNMTNMAASTEQMTGNVKTVATAVEEMTTSINEIAQSAEQASSIARNATELAESSNNMIGELDTSAGEIGNILETIQEIAEQTNLLALNATIEAARAGEAGKGFAVVATEIKELAKQTGEATGDIRQKIEGIQGSTSNVVESMGQIVDVIGQVNNVSSMIASAVEEQNVTTKDIAQHITQVSDATTTLSKGVVESASASQEITKNISGVDQAFQQASQGASQTQEASGDLAQVAEKLQAIVGKFTT